MNSGALTMYPDTIIASTQLNPLLRTFAENVWEKVNQNLDSNVSQNVGPIYWNVVEDLIGKKTNNKNKPKNKLKNKKNNKPKIPIPFYGIVENNWCCGIKKNHGLYTQCSKTRPGDGDYCKVCSRQAMNNANGKPNCGVIRDRQNQWSEKLNYKPQGMKPEIPYANVMAKLNISINEAQEVVESLGWQPIPNCHLVEKKVRRGRPKTKVAVEDSDDETPKKRGRPRKQPKPEVTDEELIAQFMASCM